MSSLSQLISDVVTAHFVAMDAWAKFDMLDEIDHPGADDAYDSAMLDDLTAFEYDQLAQAAHLEILPVRTPKAMADMLVTELSWGGEPTVIWPTSWPQWSDGFVAHRSTLNPEI